MTLTGNYKLDIVTVFIVLLTLFFFYLKWTYSYWERKGFKTFSNVSLLCGHFKDVLAQNESIGHLFTRIYRNTNEPFIGVYGFLRPMLLINDPDLIRSIFIKDFSHFVDRGVYSNEELDPLSAHLFALQGQKWKNIRTKLTPTFTSGKLKAMFSTLLDCGSTLQNHLDHLYDRGDVLDIREISACHSINVIASVGFGINVDTITTPNHEFRENMRKVFASSFWNSIRFFLRFIAPKLMYTLRIRLMDRDVEDFFISLVKENLALRESGKIFRKDFFQLLTQLRNGVSIESDDQWNANSASKSNNGEKALTVNQVAAQAFIFLAAGFETSSTTMSYCMYELARHPEIQKRVHNEIEEVLKEHDGKITYESVSEMKFLSNCIDETLRKYPVLPMLNRKCVKEYQIPGTNLIIEKGVEVFISSLGLQRNEKFYNEPNKFDPDRCIDVNGLAKQPYLPFGDGPRNCIGSRLGKMQVKVGLVLLLQKFKYELHECHKNKDLEIDPRHFLLQPRSDILLHMFKR